ncbi:MAG TPA: class I SAM-dependent methyltransferase [Herpetosiphonaceae bacterium]
MDTKAGWETMYSTKDPTQVSWYQEHPRLSLHLIQSTGIDPTAPIIDVGGGAATLVDDLLAHGFQNITVLDISAAALEAARKRLGPRAAAVTWLEADIAQVQLPHHAYTVWHDRAVFHFLTDPDDRRRYVEAMRHAVEPGGHVIVATFAPEGPRKCSGLDVVRYDARTLHDEFGDDFTLISSANETHRTPFGTDQKFIYCYCRKQ